MAQISYSDKFNNTIKTSYKEPSKKFFQDQSQDFEPGGMIFHSYKGTKIKGKESNHLRPLKIDSSITDGNAITLNSLSEDVLKKNITYSDCNRDRKHVLKLQSTIGKLRNKSPQTTEITTKISELEGHLVNANDALDSCNYERRAWVGEGGHKESPTTFTNKTKCTLKYDQPPFRVYDCNVEGDDYDNKYEHTLWDTFTRRTINNLNDNQYRYKSSFWPKTHIEVLGTPKISPTFNIATELGRDVFTNERNKLKTKISLVTDLSWESYFHDILDESSPGPRGEYFLNSIDSKDKINLNLALDVIRWPGSNRGWAQRDLLTRMRYEDVGKVLTYKEHREKAGIGVEGGYKITLRTDGDSSKPESSGNVRTFDKFTKGQIYIFYKSNVKYTNFNKKTDREVTGNFWYFITVTGKENKVKANSEISSIVPYGHTDRMIVDTDAEKGASFGDTDSDISDYSHYKNSLGQTKYDFKDRLNSIMKTHNSAAYAIKVNERHSDSGIGFELVGSVFETGDRRDYQVYYKPDPVGTNIELKWEK
tara:strand:+ start:139 stop:1743 length:1605 start_codon:yes stop_codon:yes gene_type:complete